MGHATADELFGPPRGEPASGRPLRRTRIIATIGPASATPEVMAALIEAGVDMARLNLSHLRTAHDVATHVEHLREAMVKTGRRIPLLADLQGPKIRLGALATPVTLSSGATVTLGGPQAAEGALTVEPAGLLADLRVGHRVLIDDGKVELVVTGVSGGTDPAARARVVRGGVVSSRKGLNVPDTELSERVPTRKDRGDLETVRALGIEVVAVSFVEDGGDISRVRDLLPAGVKVVAKIERPRALRNRESIFGVVDGVMVARGDLAVEVGAAEVPLWQRELHALGNRLGVVTGTATEMLESMIASPTPTRAEVNDVAGAVFEGAEFVMTSAETAVGRYPVEAVRAMDEVLRVTERGLAGVT